MSPEQLSTIIDQIYSAALNPNEWRDVALAIQSVIGAHTVNFVIEDTKNKKFRFLFTNGATLDQLEVYGNSVMSHDELTAHYNAKPTGIAYLSQEEWTVPQLNNFSAYQEFYKEIGSTYFIGGEFYRSKNSRAYVSVARSHLDPLFTKENQSVMQLLLPHLNRALCIGMHFIEKESQINSLKGDLNHLQAAIILLSEKGNLTHANALAEPYILNNLTNKGNCPVRLPDLRANRQIQESIRRILNSSEIHEPIYTNFEHIGGNTPPFVLLGTTSPIHITGQGIPRSV
ncbi:hypothetical protein [Vibrio alfacsensis]|uniref:hypothetical protein n=1 Tax=Vibrio alfacsensis TaxID=1074311 RepID=UPI001BF11E38|nr:hypothetical protein [Vibrio alfacsensis]BCN24102.1 hypothetical protein VYA_12940 [Vibrio alfacsensis]